VIEVKSNLRLILSLPLLQRSVAVEIDRDCIGRPDRFRSSQHTNGEPFCSLVR
jgi:hypothetical protein